MLLNDKPKPYRLLLASQSPRRRELMTGCGLPYELAENSTARRPIPTTFRLSAFEYLSTLKSEAIRFRCSKTTSCSRPTPSCWPVALMTAEGSTWHGRKISRQTPRSRRRPPHAEILSGAHHLVTTGVTPAPAARMTHFTSLTYVWFRTLTDEEIAYCGTTPSNPSTRPGHTAFRSGSATPPSSASKARSTTSWDFPSRKYTPN